MQVLTDPQILKENTTKMLNKSDDRDDDYMFVGTSNQIVNEIWSRIYEAIQILDGFPLGFAIIFVNQGRLQF